jgi:hypothetical protein
VHPVSTAHPYLAQAKRGNVVRDTASGVSKNYGFVHFASEADLQKAIALANGKVCGLCVLTQISSSNFGCLSIVSFLLVLVSCGA